MTAKQLTDSILQMAIQGKLVPQDPNDEPASVLLERIREEKKRMVKEKLLKKSALAETEINTDDIPFDIPETWAWTTISNIFTINPKVNGGDNDNAAFVPMEKIDAGYSSSFTYEVRSWKDIKSSYTNFADGDVAFAKITPCFQNRKSVIFSNLPNGIGAGTTELKVLRQYGESIDRKYLLYFLKSPYFINEAKFKGTANQQRIVVGYLENKYFPLPPLAEQHRIVEKIEEYLSIIKEYGCAYDEASKMDAELPDKLKKSILQEAIMGKLGTQDPSDAPAKCLLENIRAEKQKLVEEGVLKKKDLVETPVEDNEVPFNIPESWQWVRISDIVNVVMGQSPDGNDVYESSHEENAYEFHQGKICFTEKYISPSGKWCNKPARIAEIDSLLVCVRAPIGDVNITQREIGIGRGLASIKGYCDIKTEFLYYWMKAHKRNLVDQGTGSTFKAITVEVLKNQPIPLPPLAEQHRIVKKIEELYAEIDNMTINNDDVNEIDETEIEKY